MDDCEKWEWHSETKACTYYSVSKKEKKNTILWVRKKKKNYSVSKKRRKQLFCEYTNIHHKSKTDTYAQGMAFMCYWMFAY